MMTELKSCPFCGKQPMTNVYYWKCGGDELELFAEVVCTCGVSKREPFEGNNRNFEYYAKAFETAIDKWNRRAER